MADKMKLFTVRVDITVLAVDEDAAKCVVYDADFVGLAEHIERVVDVQTVSVEDMGDAPRNDTE